MKVLFVTLACLCLSIGCSAHNILVFLPLKIYSHYVQVEPIFHALAQRGHNVTVISPFPPKNKTSNFHHVFLAANKHKQIMDGFNPAEAAEKKIHPISILPKLKEVASTMGNEIFSSAVFQELIHGEHKFDLIFTELFFNQEMLVILGQIFNAPIVTYSSFGYSTDILRFAGAVNAISYITDKDFDYTGPMSVLQRLELTVTRMTKLLYNEHWYYPHLDTIISEYIPGTHPIVTDMLRNISIFFLTGNIAIGGSNLWPPNVVEISGIHLKEPAPLDKELMQIMDNARNGVIYFCYGSLIKMSHFKKEVIQTYLSVLGKLDQTVLWKTDLNTSHLEIPKNVHIKTWFDQTSVLAHPNCVLFLTHGGVSSTMETIKHAVPVIGMSFYGDQIINLANMESYGYGLRVLYNNLTEKSLDWAIKTVLGDPRFKENISRASRIFTDKPMSSLDNAVYWIEYVIRHKGAHHLKPPTIHLPWYQVFLLDVIIIFSMAILVLLYFTTKLVTFVYLKCFASSKSLKEKKY